MGKNSDIIVAEYDYYTLDQARKIIYEEMRKKKREIREEYLSVAAMLLMFIVLLMCWIVFGY